MSNLSVKHSRSFSPAKLRYREYDRVAAPVKFAWIVKMKVSIVIPCYNIVSDDFPVIHRSLMFTSVPMKVLRSGTIPVVRDVPMALHVVHSRYGFRSLYSFSVFSISCRHRPAGSKHSCNQTIARAS